MRVNRDNLNLAIAELIALRGTCERASVGAVITQDGRIVSSGYVGAPSGLSHCTDVGCEIDEATGGCRRTAHAEAGAIAYAARKGITLEGATLYTTHSPCLDCAKLIINSGIRRLVYRQSYRLRAGVDLLVAAGMDVEILPEGVYGND